VQVNDKEKSIKLIIFDLDGVLVDTKDIHYEALNLALKEIDEKYIISYEEHIKIYDGLKTNQKLEMLSKQKGLPTDVYEKIWRKKQEKTVEMFSSIVKNEYLINLLSKLKNDGFTIVCCSNSIKKTILIALSKIGIIEYFDDIISNEDVVNGKPHPDMYWKAMSKFSFLPEETLIIEDSPTGLLAAKRSSAYFMRVKDSKDFSYDIIKNEINERHKIMQPKWKDKKLNILIPMAGAGTRFQQAGYTFPKPLIDVNNKPMIQLVVENLNIDANYIFVVQKEHREKYNLDSMLNLICPGSKIVEVDSVTEGAASTTLLAKEFIDNDNPLVMANSDQFLEWNSSEFMYKMSEQKCDGGIVTFTATHPKWSFAKVDEFGNVTEVAEKNPISNIASTGIYYWAKGSDYVKYAEQMIEKNIRVNNEFYVCPVFNEAIEDNKIIKTFNIEKMWGIGTPEDLNYYLENYK
jgi:HAD superfamily hydrolase (TIGR01509 family)